MFLLTCSDSNYAFLFDMFRLLLLVSADMFRCCYLFLLACIDSNYLFLLKRLDYLLISADMFRLHLLISADIFRFHLLVSADKFTSLRL